jgi:DNA polymerase-3 subunit delta'
LLKVLEEPPAKAILFLVSHNPARLLATIRSRCRRIALGPLADDTVTELLGRFCPELGEDDRRDLAALAEGSVGRAVALGAEGGLELYHDMIEQLDRLPGLDIPAIHRLGDKIARDREGEAFRTFSELLRWWLARDIKRRAMGRDAGAAGLGARLDPRLEVWEKLTPLLSRADGINLDRKQVVLNAFHSLRNAARG